MALAPSCGRQLHTIAGQLVRPAVAVFIPRASLLTNEADDDPELVREQASARHQPLNLEYLTQRARESPGCAPLAWCGPRRQ